MSLDWGALRTTLDFILHDWLAIESLTARERFSEHSRETFDAVLDLCQQVAADQFEPINRLTDTQEPAFDAGRVVLPAHTAQAVQAYADTGMLAASQDHAWGGMQLPSVVEMAGNAFFSAASMGLKAFSLLTVGNVNLLLAHATPRQREVFARPQLDGRWHGTMNLSEPQAGSSLADITTRAWPDGADHQADLLGPRYRIRGRKMWITAGEHDMGENIVHLVLAKIADETGQLPAGVKGISLFIVPKWRVDADGQVTTVRNDIALAGLNHKLGSRAAPNALLNYGEGAGAVGYLVGQPGQGLACMFHMMNEARLQVGLGAAAQGMAGYLMSRAYARERTQGRPLPSGERGAKDPNQPPVALIEHGDVRRMLLAQKAYSEGALALVLYCGQLLDEVNTATPEAAHRAHTQLEVLTPVAKSWPSEWCVEANSLAIQILGGYGYTRDFPVEQYWRDNRLNMIHEGAHGIHAQDLLGRKVGLQGGTGYEAVLGRIAAAVQQLREQPALAGLADPLAQAVAQLRQATELARSQAGQREVMANAMAYLRGFGHVVLAWIWAELACTAQQALQRGHGDAAMQQGRLAAARYFYLHELPLAGVWLAAVASCDPLFIETPSTWL